MPTERIEERDAEDVQQEFPATNVEEENVEEKYVAVKEENDNDSEKKLSVETAGASPGVTPEKQLSPNAENGPEEEKTDDKTPQNVFGLERSLDDENEYDMPADPEISEQHAYIKSHEPKSDLEKGELVLSLLVFFLS